MVPPGDTTAMIRSGKVPAVLDPALTPAPRRRPSGRQPRFGLSDRPKRGKRVGLVLFLLLLLGGGGAAAWYFLLGPGAAAAPESVAATPPSRAPATAPDTAAAPPPARVDTAPALAQPDLIPSGPPPATPPTFAPGPIDRLSDTLIVAIRAYEERSRLYQGGLADCTVLARGLMAVDAAWTRYEEEKKQLTAQLDATRSQRDLQLFSRVDSVSANYDRSGCRRP